MMKTTLLLLVAATFCLPGLSRAKEIQVGDGFPAVLAQLGHPVGFMEISNMKYLYYPRGTVTLSNDVVTATTVVSSEAWAAQQEEARRAREARAKEEALLRAKRIEDGLALKEKMLLDPGFIEAPVEKRVALWRQFSKRYPEVELPDQYAEDLRLYELELAVRNEEKEKQREQELADLTQRVGQAEARAEYAALRASQAEAKARDAEEQASFGTRYDSGYRGYYPYTYYPYGRDSLYIPRKKKFHRHETKPAEPPRESRVVLKAWTYYDRQGGVIEEPDRYAPLSFGNRGGYQNNSLSFGSGGR